MPAPSRRLSHAIALPLAVAVALVGAPASSLGAPATPAAPATPSAAAIRAKRAQAAKASTELTRMREELAAGLAGYERVSGRLARTRREIDDNAKRLRVLKRRLGGFQQGLGVRADYIYRTRGTGMLDVLLSAATFDEFVERLDLVTSLASRDAAVIAQVKRARAEATRLQGTLKEREAMLAGLQKKAEAERARVQAQVDAQESRLGDLDADVAKLIRDAERAAAPRQTPPPSPVSSGGGKPKKTSSKVALVSAKVAQHPGVGYLVMAGQPTSYSTTGVKLSGKASIYSTRECGTHTASGRPLNDSELTCAHPSLPFGTRLAVTKGSKRIIVIVTDRGPYTGKRILDLTVRAASILGIDGVGSVTAEVVVPQ